MEARRILSKLLPVLLCLSSAGASKPRSDKITCAYYDSGFVSNDIKALSEGPDGVISADNKTITCMKEENLVVPGCFVFWDDDKVLRQGCWHCDNSDCPFSKCRNTMERSANFLFCACQGDLCNVNFTNVYNASAAKATTTGVKAPETHHLPAENDNHIIIIIAIASVSGVAMVIILAYFAYRMFMMTRRRPLETSSLIEDPPSQPMFETDDLKLASLINRGRYGEVWKGMLNDTEVAVKVFTHSQKQYFNNERDIYSLPHVEHPSIVKCFGADERISIDGNPEYMLVLTYAPLGSLHGYLKNNILDWHQLCRMARSVACGLAHLHTDIQQGDSFKPAVAHRDFNSRNVLVKPDLTCCITDMGFAIKIMGSKFFKNGQEENAEQSSLNDVGTLRYMAPEVLDGAVNLRDCESSLKQIDVYSLGLVLWELTSRTKELYPGSIVPEYCLPFQAELGLHPTFDEMQQLVSKNKKRPALPRVCHAVNSTQPHLQAIRALKETMEDCWDQDAEARLTSMCVEERVSEMATLWDSRSKGVTPTAVNLTLSQPTSTTDTMIDSTVNTMEIPVESHPHMCRSMSDSDDVVLGQYNRMPRQRESMSTLTVETVLSPSLDGSERADSVPSARKENVNLKYELAQKAFQPHQGRNPTVERNTHKKSDEELAVFGNTLMDAKLAAQRQAEKEKLQQEQQQQRQRQGRERQARGGEGGYDNMDSALMQNDVLSLHRNTPIPYVQNQVHEPNVTSASAAAVVRPKVANVPGNGTHHGNVNDAQKTPNKSKRNKEKGGIFGFLSKNFKSNSNHSVNIDGGASAGPATAHARSNSDGQPTILDKRNVDPEEQRPLLTEVRVINGSPVVRPATLSVSDSSSGDSRLGVAEVGVAKLQAANGAEGLPFRVRERDNPNRVQSATDLSPSGFASVQKAVRPNSLRLRGHNYKSDPQLNGLGSKDASQARGRRREKTPRRHSNGSSKLSLHNGSAESVHSKNSSNLSLSRGARVSARQEGTELDLFSGTVDPSC